LLSSTSSPAPAKTLLKNQTVVLNTAVFTVLVSSFERDTGINLEKQTALSLAQCRMLLMFSHRYLQVTFINDQDA
jgi:hypothetical protein